MSEPLIAVPAQLTELELTLVLPLFAMRFRFDLIEPPKVVRNAHGWEIPAGAARFNIAVEVEGKGESVTVVNESPILWSELAPGQGSCPTSAVRCLANRPFSLGYTEKDGARWVVEIGATDWAE